MFCAQFWSRKFKSKSELNIQDLKRLEMQARWNLGVIVMVIVNVNFDFEERRTTKHPRELSGS